jgi:peptidoglycan-associated lipoprotein
LDVGKSATDTLPVSSRLVYFDYDSFVIKAESQSLVESNARLIKADKNRKVVIEGHTDERGGREYNLALGQKRAEAVRRALVLLGVADSQLEAVSFGKEKPMVAGADEASLAKNRRAEISYR